MKKKNVAIKAVTVEVVGLRLSYVRDLNQTSQNFGVLRNKNYSDFETYLVCVNVSFLLSKMCQTYLKLEINRKLTAAELHCNEKKTTKNYLNIYTKCSTTVHMYYIMFTA